MPFTLAECAAAGAPVGGDDALFTGGYPSIHAQGRAPDEALGDYVMTYLERDVRRIGAVQDLNA
ncbi:MAG: AAA family ATPase, partial [bacterium]|nr:AAA family ATPase [bacterium]